MNNSSDNGSSRASKRAKMEPTQAPATASHHVSVLANIFVKATSVALQWRDDGYPGSEFLKQIGLECLSEISWRITDAASSLVKEFVVNYDVYTYESRVDGLVIKLSPELISRLMSLPNQGLKVEPKKKVRAPDRLKFFRAGAFNEVEQSFRNELANDQSHARIFSLVSEVILLEPAPGFNRTSAGLLEVISEAVEGKVVNWSAFICEKLSSRIAELKEKVVRKQATSLSGSACSWIAHFIKVLLEQQETSRGTVSQPPLSQSLESTKLSSVLAQLTGRAEMQETSIEELKQRLEESEQRNVKLVEANKKLRAVVQTKEKLLQAGNESMRKALDKVEAAEKSLREARSKVEVMEKRNVELVSTIAGLQAEVQGKHLSYGAQILERIRKDAEPFRVAQSRLEETLRGMTDEIEHAKKMRASF